MSTQCGRIHKSAKFFSTQFSVMFYVVKVNSFNGSNDNPARGDKNGKMPVILESFNGTLPERARVISGTVAERAGFEVGNVYLAKVEKVGVDPTYGDQFRHSTVGAISALELAINLQKFPVGQVVNSVPVAEKVAEGVEEGKF